MFGKHSTQIKREKESIILLRRLYEVLVYFSFVWIDYRVLGAVIEHVVSCLAIRGTALLGPSLYTRASIADYWFQKADYN